MEIGDTLKVEGTSETERDSRTGRSGLFRSAARWFPLIFPWAPLRRMTGAVVTESWVTMARGRLDGRYLHVDGTVRVAIGEGPLDFGELGISGDEPVCVCLPREKTMVRHFRVPSSSDEEIEAMLPHLLAAELPLSTEHLSWVWVFLPVRNDGFSRIAVSVARNDHLEEYLAPLLEANLNILGFVPEGWCWAHLLLQERDPEETGEDTVPRSVVIQAEDDNYLVVEQGGRLLFDARLPALPSAESPSTAEDPALVEARVDFEDLLGLPLPEPEIRPRTESPVGDAGDDNASFAASVAAAGMSGERLMIPRELGLRSRRRAIGGALAGLGRLAILAFLVWTVFAVVEETRMRRYLETLENQIMNDGARVEALQGEYLAIRESTRDRSSNSEVLQVLASLRRQVKAPIALVHMNYIECRGVTLRGQAPSSDHVLEMTEQLESDPLWKGLRVMQLRSEKSGAKKSVHFVVEGQLTLGKTSREENEE